MGPAGVLAFGGGRLGRADEGEVGGEGGLRAELAGEGGGGEVDVEFLLLGDPVGPAPRHVALLTAAHHLFFHKIFSKYN